jgi:hypothetical protein
MKSELYPATSGYARWLLFAVPFLVIITGILYIHSVTHFFLDTVDPEYAYLFNGSLMACLHPDIYYVDHPGTPLIFLIAFTGRIVHLFRPEPDFLTDVIKNPELYIRSTIYAIHLINAIMVYWLGWFIFRRSGNIFLSIFLQLLPFGCYLIPEIMGRMIPESLMLPLVCLWTMAVFSVLQDDHASWTSKTGLIFGVMCGFSLALKLTMLPYLFIPLILLKGWKSRIVFLISFVVFFFLFAFPVLYRYHYFTTWVRNIITHTGTYGGGDKGLAHWNDFRDHLKFLFSHTLFLVISCGILCISMLLRFLRKEKEAVMIRLGVALLLTVVLQYIITAKHFAFHYMMPALLLTVPILLLSIVCFYDQRFHLSDKVKNSVLSVVGIAVLMLIIKPVYRQLEAKYDYRKEKLASFSDYQAFNNHGPLIISASYYGCSAMEYALIFGVQWCGKYSAMMYDKVMSIYPDTHMYYPWSNRFYAGSSEIKASEFLDERKVYRLYMSEFSQEKLDELTGILNQSSNTTWKTVSIYQSKKFNDAIFQLQVEGR